MPTWAPSAITGRMHLDKPPRCPKIKLQQLKVQVARDHQNASALTTMHKTNLSSLETDVATIAMGRRRLVIHFMRPQVDLKDSLQGTRRSRSWLLALILARRSALSVIAFTGWRTKIYKPRLVRSGVLLIGQSLYTISYSTQFSLAADSHNHLLSGPANVWIRYSSGVFGSRKQVPSELWYFIRPAEQRSSVDSNDSPSLVRYHLFVNWGNLNDLSRLPRMLTKWPICCGGTP